MTRAALSRPMGEFVLWFVLRFALWFVLRFVLWFATRRPQTARTSTRASDPANSRMATSTPGTGVER